MTARPCLGCGQITTSGSYHPQCHVRRGYTYAERQRRARAVIEHVRINGDWCPGYNRPSHRTADLTADHIHPVAAGGPEAGRLAVLCRSCNSSKGDRS